MFATEQHVFGNSSKKIQIGDIIPKPMGIVWHVDMHALTTQNVPQLNVTGDIVVGGEKEHVIS